MKEIKLTKKQEEKMFDTCARKVTLTHPETGEVEVLGDNWKSFREVLEDGWEKNWFDRQVLQIMADEIKNAASESLEKKDG